MYRNAISDLHIWRNSSRRKPLIIRGARQTGKTWLVREFAGQFDSFVEIAFCCDC
ncbi:MAG: hypothetical protein U9R29_10685 [Thermodesulfobacteriota bacterium]|nr:hypothetical protein [Thermodesulfobacteriota bacterium]